MEWSRLKASWAWLVAGAASLFGFLCRLPGLANRHRIVKRTRLQAKGLRLLIVEAILIFVTLVAVILVTVEVVDPSVRIEVVSVPLDLAKIGFTEAAAEKLVRAELKRMEEKADSVLSQSDYWQARELPKISVPETDLGIGDLAKQIRRVMGLGPAEIKVIVERRGNKIFTRVSASRPAMADAKADAKAWPPVTDTDGIIHNVAEQIMYLIRPYLLAAYLQEAGRDEDCLRIIADIQRMLPPRDEAHIRSYLLKAIILRKREAYPDALFEVGRALSIDPHFSPAHIQLGNIYVATGDVTSAIAAYRDAVDLDDSDPIAKFDLAYALQETKDLAGAEAMYRKAIATDPTYAYAHHYLAILLTDQGKIEEAISESRDAITYDGTRAEFHGQLSKELRLFGQSAEADIECRRAEDLSQDEPIDPCR